MAFMLGLRIVSYGVVGAAAILTHETTKAYTERLYHWAREKFMSRGSPPQPGGPTHDQCEAENQPTRQHSLDGAAHLSLPHLQQQQLSTTCKDDDALLSKPQPQHHQQHTTTCKDEYDAHLSVLLLLQLQQLTPTEKESDDDAHLSVLQQQQLTPNKKESDDDAHLSVLQQPQQLTPTEKESDDDAHLSVQQQQQLSPTEKESDDDAHLSVLPQPQQLTPTEKESDDDAHLSVPQQQQQFTSADKEDDVNLPMLQLQQKQQQQQQQQKQLTAVGKDNDVYHLNHDPSVKTNCLIDIEFELKTSSETSKDHDDVRIEGGAKHDQQAPRLPERGATFIAKVFNAAKSQLHGFFCWARGLFEDKRWATVRRVSAQIVRKMFLVFADDLFHNVLKRKNPVLRQFSTVIYNEVKKAFL